jgi:hypothetical protein
VVKVYLAGVRQCGQERMIHTDLIDPICPTRIAARS